MVRIGLIREGKIPPDNRVAFTPAQCKWINKNIEGVEIIAQSSDIRCFSDKEYRIAGVKVEDDVSDCDILFGIKEVPVSMLIPGKTYFFFSHTKKKQAHNQRLFHTILKNKITLVDYECLEYEDGQRILGFGFFAGVVGAHNGIMAFGTRTGAYQLDRVYKQRSFRELIHNYFGLRLPNIKIAVTGSGRVAHGILEVMNLLEVIEVEPADYVARSYNYPVFTQLKGADLYCPPAGKYNREDFHRQPSAYECLFYPYTKITDILMNGIYWDENVPRLFECEHLAEPDFKIQTIADITDDKGGSIPCNLGDGTIEEPVYGVDRKTLEKTEPYLTGSVDIMAVGNLPNELPRDASRYFGEQLMKHVLRDLVTNGSSIIDRATIVKHGEITEHFAYLGDYGRLASNN
jgi:saccharopine dehydrogenase (NAD+, L-lysine forming)